MRRLFLFRKATQILILTGGRRRHAPRRPVAAIAGSEPTVGRRRSIQKSPTSGAKSSTPISRKRRGSHDPHPAAVGVKKSASTSKDSSTPAVSMPCTDDPSSTKYGGEILVLFETPSGFAIFCLNLNHPKAMENIWAIFHNYHTTREIVWLKEFQTFEDKSSAINHGTGVNRELNDMIMRYHRPCQALAVGKPEYKRIIETSLGLPCLLDDTVMDVMWGLKNLMHCLVPQEEVKLSKEDRLPMSQGLIMFLDRHGFDVKPEMVDEEVVTLAFLLLDAELVEKSHSESLCWFAEKLKDVSGIDSEGWAPLKIVNALKIMFVPLQSTEAEIEMFTREELIAFVRDSYKYEDLIRLDIMKIDNGLRLMRIVLEMLGRKFS